MFQFVNPVTFKYFLPFLVFYILLIIFSFVFKLTIKKMAKDQRRIVRKSFGYFAESCMWIGLLGLLYLGARRYNVYFLSMEFLHVVNFAVLGLFFGCGVKKYRKMLSK